MSEPEKKWHAETKPKNFRNNWSFFMASINSLDYAIWSILENKTNATSHPNIGLLKTAIKEEWNKMSEEFILKACDHFEGVFIQ